MKILLILLGISVAVVGSIEIPIIVKLARMTKKEPTE